MTNTKQFNNDPYSFIDKHRFGFNSVNNSMGMLPLVVFESGNLNAIHLNQSSIFVKSRQMYFTSLVSAYVAWFAAINNKKDTFIICPNASQAKEFLRKVKMTLQHYFGDEYEKNVTDNSTSITLKNGSTIQARTQHSNAVQFCSYKIDLLIVEEAAFIDDLKNILFSAGAAFTPQYKCVIYSSVNYEDDYFMQLYYGALKGENGFQAVKRLWNENPNYPLSFYEEKKAALGENIMKQEYDCIPKNRQLKPALKKNIITFRMDKWMEVEVTKKLIQKTEELGESYTVSTYLRELILKDLVNK